jgi:hypothetical protein
MSKDLQHRSLIWKRLYHYDQRICIGIHTWRVTRVFALAFTHGESSGSGRSGQQEEEHNLRPAVMTESASLLLLEPNKGKNPSKFESSSWYIFNCAS